MFNTSAGFLTILCSNETMLLLNVAAIVFTLTYIGKLLFEFGDTYTVEDSGVRAGVKRSLVNQSVAPKVRITD